MTQHYYCLKNLSNQRQDFNADVPSIVSFLKMYAQDQGLIYVENIKGFRIKYDLQEGKVRTIIDQVNTRIQNIYSTKAFENYLFPIRLAISAFARLELLLQIAQLQDKALENFVRASHHVNNQFINLDIEQINYTLRRLQTNFDKPPILAIFKRNTPLSEAHDAVRRALYVFGINQVNCKQDVAKVMQQVAEFQKAAKTKNEFTQEL